MFKLGNTATAVIDLEAAFDHRQCALLGRWLAKKLGCAVRVHGQDRKSTRLNSSHMSESRMPSSA